MSVGSRLRVEGQGQGQAIGAIGPSVIPFVADDLPEAVQHAIVRVGARSRAGLQLPVGCELGSQRGKSVQSKNSEDSHAGFWLEGEKWSAAATVISRWHLGILSRLHTDDIQRVHDQNLCTGVSMGASPEAGRRRLADLGDTGDRAFDSYPCQHSAGEARLCP